MPVRNGGKWLAEACRSVTAQTLADLELIVVDDGSTDETPDIARSFAAADPRVRIARQPSLGLVSALNQGLALARATLVARLDADDIAMPSRFERQAEIMTADERLVLLGTWATKIDAGGNVCGRLNPDFADAAVARCLADRNPFVHSSVMMRRAAVLGVGSYRAACQGAEDYDLWLRLAEAGAVDILHEELVAYRVHAASATRTAAVRQCFAARLARLAAAERRAGRPDPAAGLSAAPDWWDDHVATGALEASALLCRLLDFAESDAERRSGLDGVRLPEWDAVGPMVHAEKVLLRRAVLNVMQMRGRPSHLGMPALVHALYVSLVA
jgi:hypothetical protein